MSGRVAGVVLHASRRPLSLGGVVVKAVRGRKAWACLMVGAVLTAFGAGASAGVAGGRQEPRHPILWAGAEWKSFGSREKQAYLSGFIAGAAAEQALAVTAATGSTKDSAVPSGAIAKLREGKQLNFPFAPSVYGVQVDDYYWWTDHLGTPITDVMLSVNYQMRHP